MSEQFTSAVPDRYKEIDERNTHSLYMTDAHRPFTVNMSVHSAGSERYMYNVFDAPDDDTVAAGKAANRLIKFPIPGRRFPLAGNMSTALDPKGEPYGPKDLPSEVRLDDARRNMNTYMESLDIDPASVRVLFPDRDYETPLQVVNIDEDGAVYDGTEPAKLQNRGDMIYTYNPNIVLGVRPADCPLVVISAETPKGRIYSMVHFAWLGAANDQLSDMKREFAALDMDLSTATVYLTPGGQSETFPHMNAAQNPNEKYPTATGLFEGVEAYEKNGEEKFKFSIDTPNFVYDGLLNMGLEPDQIFVDTSDTTAPNSGYASHSRASRLADDNSRDFVTVKLEAAPSMIASNPDRPVPPEIEWQIIPVEVEYVDFNGDLQQGSIEVNRDAYEDVKNFFTIAKEIRFPIEKLVKSSDAPYTWDDDKLMEANTTSGFNYRLIKGTETPSLHGLGLAFDVNTRLNPYIRYEEDGTASVDPEGAVYDPTQPGVLTAEHPLVLFMKDRGWQWGGDWPAESGRTDYQHFQKAPKN